MIHHEMTVHTRIWYAQYGTRSSQKTTCSCGYEEHGDATQAHEHDVVLQTLGLKFTVDRPKETYDHS